MPKYSKQSTQPNILTQIGLALAGLFRLIFKPAAKFDRTKMLAQFTAIESLLASGDTIHAAQAVVQADSFLDGVMKQATSAGPTFADRLRNLEPKFSRDIYQTIWEAHKLRNHIAHEQPQVSVQQAQSAIQTFRRAASQLGAF